MLSSLGPHRSLRLQRCLSPVAPPRGCMRPVDQYHNDYKLTHYAYLSLNIMVPFHLEVIVRFRDSLGFYPVTLCFHLSRINRTTIPLGQLGCPHARGWSQHCRLALVV